jgi:hypothetical protein
MRQAAPADSTDSIRFRASTPGIAPEMIGFDLLAFIMVSWSNPKVEAGFPVE